MHCARGGGNLTDECMSSQWGRAACTLQLGNMDPGRQEKSPKWEELIWEGDQFQ